jgi:rhamnulokinase
MQVEVMMYPCYLAIDIGASSGRHIVGWIENEKILIKEIYRFENRLEKKNGRLCWDIERLFDEVITGMRQCKIQGFIPVSLGIDTWGADFILLDKDGTRLGDAVSYRDSRTVGMDREVEKILSFDELYRLTGIQKQSFNTIYQLMALKKEDDILEKAEDFLMMPDYLHYRLTSVKTNEYTNATTTSLVSGGDWNWDIIRAIGFPEKIFKPLNKAGKRIGTLSKAVSDTVGFSCAVTLPATHDTGSAFLALPLPPSQTDLNSDESKNSGTVYISSGTWSLLGIETPVPIITAEGMRANFSNEGGYEYRYRFLKNIMGLWMVQSVRNELETRYSFNELCSMADEAASFSTIVDVNNPVFLAPASMITAIKEVCAQDGQAVPKTTGEIMQCLYQNLAASYRDAIHSMEKITGRKFTAVNIVGGGCKDEYLNRLTAKVTGLSVSAGPVEATVIGNLIVQMIADGEVADLASARQIIERSFEIKHKEVYDVAI